MRVVLDTNLIISRYLSPGGRVARLFDLWESGAFEVLASEAMLDEYARALRYPHLSARHGLSESRLAEIDEAFRELSTRVEASSVTPVVVDDPDDDVFLACAVSGGADVLVSGDGHLRRPGAHQGIPILTPAEFLVRFFPE